MPILICIFTPGKIQTLKKTTNKADKKRKRELTEEIARLEIELDKKHQEELSQFSQSNANVSYQFLYILSSIYLHE